MKIVVLSSSGNVGKSLICRELFLSRLENCLIIEVETVNRGSKEMAHLNVEQFKSGEDFMSLYLKILETENIIIDIGASNLSNFWEQMQSYSGIEELFDLFVVPVTQGDKEMTDTYKTISFLRSEGINDEKIRVIFNRVKSTVENDFAVLLSADFDFDTDLAIKESGLFKDLGLMKLTISDIYNENVDAYKSQILSEKDGHKKLMLVKKDLANRMAVKTKKDLDFIFSKIIKADTPEPLKKEEKKKVNAEPEQLINDDDEEL